MKDPFNHLKILHEKIDAKMGQLGFSQEKRKFDPHLTLARIKPSKGKARGFFENLKQELDSIPPIDVGFFQVSFVRLVQSELTLEGPIYTILDEFFLKSDV